MTDFYTIKTLVSPIAKEYGVKKMFLFGSYAKGFARSESDVDLLIEKGKPLSLVGLSGMRQQCQEALNCPVDLLTTSGITEDFRREISGTEILLYEE